MATAFIPNHKYFPDEKLKNKKKSKVFYSLNCLACYVSILNPNNFKSIN
ncbi:hypothetical protein CSC02_0674 [Enterobacter hormaechei subsp. hoffmannii]|nr:hypothetical protein CSC02_0674 [Enterobacter hormaechei subsp. hoffmannii]